MTPSQKETTKLYSNHFIKVRRMSSIQITLPRYEGCSSKDVPTKLRKEWIVKNGDRLSMREVFCVSHQELRSIHCKKE